MISPLTCQELVELVTDYLEGNLSPADHSRFEQHLSGCTACSNYLSQMRQTIKFVGRLTPEDLPVAQQSELLQLFREWKNNPLN